jgi:DNA-binding NtrC family response regulator
MSHRTFQSSGEASRGPVTVDSTLLDLPSPPFRKAIAQIRRFARDDSAPVLIEGESGTGKTQIARALHGWSSRARGPYHVVVLSTLDDTLASSELFGHVAGAFTDARVKRTGHFLTANGGTLFLDEIGKASLAVQQKLLHAIEYREIRPVGSDRDICVDVRLVAATNVNLESRVASEHFLGDLHARLAAFRVRLPPLRERRVDIPALVQQYVHTFHAQCGYAKPPVVDERLMQSLCAAEWPNNLRQLSATVHRILVDAEGAAVLTLGHCLDDLEYLREMRGPEGQRFLTAAAVEEAISRAQSIAGAARILGVDRTTIYRFRRRQSRDPRISERLDQVWRWSDATSIHVLRNGHLEISEVGRIDATL